VSALPPRWTTEQITAHVAEATNAFRSERFDEPLEKWQTEVDLRIEEFNRLFDEFGLADPASLDPGILPTIIEEGLLDGLRYVAGPPVSADDLKTLAEVESLARTPLMTRPGDAKAILDVIRATVDPRRFPWIAAKRAPTEEEKRAAVFASALLHAAQRLQSYRRNNAKSMQEALVRATLAARGFTGKKLKRIPPGGYQAFPPPGVYSENEVLFGPAKADVLACLWDGRILAVECKVSNSEVNSYKRLNHDTLAKNTSWGRSFGDAVIPAAILSGVYSPANVETAQVAGLAIFWAHRVSDLGDFVEATRT